MELFYAPYLQKGHLILENMEARHCTQVLRHKVGQNIYVTDGLGLLYQATITQISRHQCHFEVVQSIPATPPPQQQIHIGIAPTKNNSRLEWFLEKATEIGITEITPIITNRSERKKLRLERLQKIILTAMKQSLRSYLPILNEPISLTDFFKNDLTKSTKVERYIAYIHPDSLPLQKRYKGTDVTILIGPEGGFTVKEVELAIHHQFAPVSLGNSRLRTETAGIVACHTIQLVGTNYML